MRILHVTHLFGTECSGGVQEYAGGLALRQRADGHEVEVLTGSMALDPEGGVTRAEWQGIPVTTVRRRQDERHSGDFGSDRIGRLVDGVLEAFRPELCHVHHWQGLTNDLVRRCAARGARTVVTLHDLYTTCALFFRMRVDTETCRPDLPLSQCAACLLGGFADTGPEAMEAMLASRHEQFQRELTAADAVSTMSRYMRGQLLAVPWWRRREIEVLPIGVVREAIDAVPPPAPVPGRLRIANWAGIAPRKGIHVLLEALAGSARAAAFEVHLHGREDHADYVAHLRRLQGCLDVRWHGPFTEAAKLREIAAGCDLAVFPSLEEPYGLAQDEALLLGMPIVVSPHGAPPERVLGRGVVAPSGSPEALREVLEALLDDPGRLEALRQAPSGGRHVAQHIPELRSLYERVLASPADGTPSGAPPPDAAALLRHARERMAAGDFRRAVLALDRAAALDPDSAPAYEALGRAHLAAGAARRALGCLDRAILLKPDSAALYHERGRAWARAGELEAAIGNFDRAIDLDPGLAAAYSGRGRAWLDRGDVATAIGNLDRAIDLDPDLAAAYAHRGRAWLARGDAATALGNLDRAITLEPSLVEAHVDRGLAWERLGNPQTAIDAYSMAIAIDPRHAPAWHHRAAARRAAGDTERADADLRRARDLDADPQDGPAVPLRRVRAW